MQGGDAHDVLEGGDGNDVMDGGAGEDILNGEAGADTLIGGAGYDTYVYFAPGFGIDTIQDTAAVAGEGNRIFLTRRASSGVTLRSRRIKWPKRSRSKWAAAEQTRSSSPILIRPAQMGRWLSSICNFSTVRSSICWTY